MAEHQAAIRRSALEVSNLAFTLAGMIIETVSGETWAGYLQKHIFDPWI